MKLLYKIQKSLYVSLLMLFVASGLQASNGGASSIDFTSEAFELAKQRATDEGKLFFVDFYANWCTPCKWMESTTFKDKEVVSTLNTNYVSIKVDIDTKEGFSIKEKYQISVLPTLLIFNSEGELVERVQETLSRSKLMNLLTFHIQKDTKVVQNHYFNQSPNKSANIQAPKEDKYKEYRSTNSNKSTYRIQVGDYNNYEAALRKVTEIREEFLEEIIVLNDYRDGAVWYRVLMGNFGSESEATSFQTILKRDFQIDSIVY